MAVAVVSSSLDAQTWTFEDVCAFLHCGRSTLNLWIKAGRVPQPRRIGRRLLFDPAAIRALVAPQVQAAGA